MRLIFQFLSIMQSHTWVPIEEDLLYLRLFNFSASSNGGLISFLFLIGDLFESSLVKLFVDIPGWVTDKFCQSSFISIISKDMKSSFGHFYKGVKVIVLNEGIYCLLF